MRAPGGAVLGLAGRRCPLSLSAGPSACAVAGVRWRGEAGQDFEGQEDEAAKSWRWWLKGGPEGLPKAACSWKKGSELPSLPGQGSERSPDTPQGWIPRGSPPMQPHPYAWPSPLFPGHRAGTILASNALSWLASLCGPLSAPVQLHPGPQPGRGSELATPGDVGRGVHWRRPGRHHPARPATSRCPRALAAFSSGSGGTHLAQR